MSWNDQGGDRDPWGGNNQQGPPDLDEAFKKLQDKLSSIFGGNKRPSGSNGSGKGGGDFKMPVSAGLLAGILVAIWIVSGFYIVDPAEEGVITRFGEYNRTEQAGPHWLPTFIERAELVNVQEVRDAEVGFRSQGRGKGSVPHEALMLTQDQNIIDIEFAVQYRIKDAKDYLFNVREPDITLRHATESAVREIVGKNNMNFIITGGRDVVASETHTLTQEILDRYNTGLIVTSVNMQDAQPPAQVQEAFDDAIKAEEDEVRLKNEAEAYANDILPKARGDADAMRAQAEGYKQRVVALADGEVSRFTAIMKEYQKAPQVTRERMYLDAVEEVLGSTSKILMDKDGSNNMLFLPLEKMMSQMSSTKSDSSGSHSSSGSSSLPSAIRNSRQRMEDFRGRSR